MATRYVYCVRVRVMEMRDEGNKYCVPVMEIKERRRTNKKKEKCTRVSHATSPEK